jgi:hypothetical protein
MARSVGDRVLWAWALRPDGHWDKLPHLPAPVSSLYCTQGAIPLTRDAQRSRSVTVQSSICLLLIISNTRSFRSLQSLLLSELVAYLSSWVTPPKARDPRPNMKDASYRHCKANAWGSNSQLLFKRPATIICALSFFMCHSAPHTNNDFLAHACTLWKTKNLELGFRTGLLLTSDRQETEQGKGSMNFSVFENHYKEVVSGCKVVPPSLLDLPGWASEVQCWALSARVPLSASYTHPAHRMDIYEGHVCTHTSASSADHSTEGKISGPQIHNLASSRA